MEKLEKLAEFEGFTSVEDLLETYVADDVVPGICSVCDYSTSVEPDCDNGFCEDCDANTVQSCLVLAGLL